MPREGNPIRWGVIGGSGFAVNAGAAIVAADGARLVAVLSRDAREARRSIRWMNGLDLANRLGGPRLTNKLIYSRLGKRLDAVRRLGSLAPRHVRIEHDLDAFLNAPGLDAVWVASPPFLHAEHAIAALAAGKHVLCEKPLAADLSDARAIVEAGKTSDRRLFIGYHMRQHSAHQQIRDEIGRGAYGQIQSFDAVMHFRHPDPLPWHKVRSQCGGWAINEAGTHLIDLAFWLLGDVAGALVDVSARLSNASQHFETDDHALLTLRFSTGTVARLDISTAAPVNAEWFSVVGTTGHVRCDGSLFGHGGTRTDRSNVATPLPAVNLHRLQVESFGQAIFGGEAEPLASGDDGLRNLEVVARAVGRGSEHL